MSLQLWIPLNGKIENQGLYFSNDGFTTSTTPPTVNENGKIGQCYAFNGNFLRCSYPARTNEISFCVWLKFNTISNCHIIDARTSGSTGYQPLYYSNGSGIQVGSNKSSFPYIPYTFTAGKWYHVAITYNSQKTSLYVNGQLINSATSSKAFNYEQDLLLTLGGRGSSSGNSTVNPFNGYLNDFRLYDHCLSKKEVEEIAKGLVLHYKLDDEFCESTVNLFKANPCRGGSTNRWTPYGNGVKIDWTSNAGDTYWYLDLADGVTLTQNNVYTLSFKCKGIGNNTVMFAWCNLAGNRIILHNGWNQYTFSMPSTGITRPFFDDITRDTSLSNLQIYDFQLEEKGYATPYTSSTRISTTIDDVSGYSNSGTIISSLSASTDTPKYSHSISFNGVDSGISTTAKLSSIFNTEFTMSFWIKSDGENGNRSVYFGNYQTDYNFNIEKDTNNLIRFYWHGSPDLHLSGTAVLDGVWNLITIVKTNTAILTYINGVLKNTDTSSLATRAFSNFWRIGRDSRTGATCYKGKMSDFRIYATALSDKQVKELYDTSSTIDAIGNIYTREYIEAGIEE